MNLPAAACRVSKLNQVRWNENADTERFMRTMKEELVWINEWNSPKKFLEALDRWIDYYNNSYLHSTLGYQSPASFEEEFNRHDTRLVNAC